MILYWTCLCSFLLVQDLDLDPMSKPSNRKKNQLKELGCKKGKLQRQGRTFPFLHYIYIYLSY